MNEKTASSIEVLSCHGGMAMSRLDLEEAYRIFQQLLSRYSDAKLDAERIKTLEALYHTTGFEARGQMSWQQQCHRLFDELFADKDSAAYALMTDRLLFYRFCPGAYCIPSPHKQLRTLWMHRLCQWADQLADSDDSTWAGESLCTHFLRLRYIADTGYDEVAGRKGRAREYEQRVRSCFFECLLSLMRSVATYVPTYVAAYHSLRRLMHDYEKEERRYKQFFNRVCEVQKKFARNSHRWLQLEELKVDYENLWPIYIKYVNSGRVYQTL